MASYEHTPAAWAVVSWAQQEAKRLGFPFVQREQLFLGLLHDKTVGRIFRSLGCDLESIRKEVERRLSPGLGAPEDASRIGLLPTANQVYRHRAKAAAALLGHTHIGPEHILVGLLMEQHGVVAAALAALGVTREQVLDAIQRLDR